MSVPRIAALTLVTALVAASAACTSEDSAEESSGAAATPGTSQHASADSATNSSSSSAEPPTEKFEPILEHALANAKGKSFTSATVSFPPGSRALPHRHGQAFVFAYVLEGRVRSQVGDGSVETYDQGEFWVEDPGAHHVLTENVSTTEPAKLLVTFVADTGAALKVDDHR